MKLLVLTLLLCAAVALTKADPSETELNDGDSTEPESVAETELSEAEDPESDETAEDPDAGETDEDPDSGETAEDPESGEKVKRSCYRAATWYTYGGRHYIYFPYNYHWAYAQRFCQAYGGTLASVHNVYVNRFLKRLAHRRPAWIGLSDAQYNGYWLWSNGERWVYANWCRAQPNNFRGIEACAVTNWSRAKCWDDQNCKLGRPFVCERK